MANIWLVNHYASTPSTGMGGRHHYFARALAAMGHNVTLVAARDHHMLRQGVDTSTLPAEEEVDGYRFRRLDVPRYSHAHDKRRVLAWVTFAARLSAMRVTPAERPDVVLYSSPQLLGFLGAERLARRFGARLVFEVRDIWPLTLTEIGGFSPRHPVIRLFQWIEDRAYARADRVVSNLPAAVEHMVTRGMDRRKFAWISNGIALDEVSEPEPLSQELLDRIPKSVLRVVYTGTLGEANMLATLIESASLVRNLPICFLIVGQGGNRNALELLCANLKLENVYFLGSVRKRQVQAVLSLADVLYIGWQNSSLYRFGISANKIPEYLFSGKPVIHSYSGACDPINEHAAGISVPAEDPEKVAAALRKMLSISSEERDRIGSNGHEAAIRNHDYRNLAERLHDFILS